MNPLERKIINMIKTEGPLTFEKFMSVALYDKEYGYYVKEKTRIGREGDFFTSPHLHPVFGIMIGKQIEEMWELLGNPDDFSLIEMGPGTGYVCKDMLDYLKKRELFKSLKYFIVELSSSTRDRQKDLLSEFSDKIRWVDSLNDIGEVRGCIFSNELLDAFPVHLVRMDDSLNEIYVDIIDSKFVEREGQPGTKALAEYFTEFAIEPERGYTTEVNLKIRDWLKDINNILEEGFILTIDYGYPAWEYYNEDRNRGTLMCYHRHQWNEDPLINIGEQDITAHVNFSAVSKWGKENSFETIGYCSQGTFLVSLGIDEEIRRLASDSEDYLSELTRIKRLILPQGMGESHKVLIQYKGDKIMKLKGFTIRNKVSSL